MKISREIQIDYGHCLPPAHFGFCSNLHGHRARVVCVFEGVVKNEEANPENGMIMDFSICKKIMMEEIHDVLDHGFAIWENESVDMVVVDTNEVIPDENKLVRINTLDFIKARNSKVLVLSNPPTAEVLAEHFFKKVKEKLHNIQHDFNKAADEYVKLVEIHWYETPNNVAIISGE